MLDAWLATNPPDRYVVLVAQVLDAFAWRSDVTAQWFSNEDAATGDRAVMPRDELMIVIRPYSDEGDPAQFSLVAIELSRPDSN